jgi:hypothetical protein
VANANAVDKFINVLLVPCLLRPTYCESLCDFESGADIFNVERNELLCRPTVN